MSSYTKPVRKINPYIKKARKIVKRHVKHGLSKVDAAEKGLITSVGSERGYRQGLAHYLEWAELNSVPPDSLGNKIYLKAYLEEMCECLAQSTLDQERNALRIAYCQNLKKYISLKETLLKSRSYTMLQILQIVKYQTLKNYICTYLAFLCGLRAHEFGTLAPFELRKESSRRKWDSRRFSGLPLHKLYTVIGKGGLIRLVAVPLWLSVMLEKHRRIEPIFVVDREVKYLSFYDISFGKKWSQSFSRASSRAIGSSRGGHGLRHSYAKWRLHVLIDHFKTLYPKMSNRKVLAIAHLLISQELGHFRPSITSTYMR